MNRFFLFSKVFCRCFGLKRVEKPVLGKKKHTPQFPGTTIAGIWAKQATRQLFFFIYKRDG